MKRLLVPIFAVAVLLGAVAGALHQYEQVPRENPLGKHLLYLPTATFIKLISLGNYGLAADIMYLWSIQYYSLFEPNTQFLYLDQVFDLITDIDPLYRDAYRIGAIIMLIEAEGDPDKRRQSVLKLLDKGIEKIPDDYSLAEEAAWHCYISFQDTDLAAHYARIAIDRPNVPHRVRRLYGYMAARSGMMTIDEAISYWESALAEATGKHQIIVSRNMLYDLHARKDKEIFEPYLKAYQQRFGRCPTEWRQIIDTGITVNGRRLKEPPTDYAGHEYVINEENCTVESRKQLQERQ